MEERDKARRVKLMTKEEHDLNLALLDEAKKGMKEGKFEQLKFKDVGVKITKFD